MLNNKKAKNSETMQVQNEKEKKNGEMSKERDRCARMKDVE